jgi:hypothetical protein
MVKLNILFEYISKYTAVVLAAILLSGCLGGTVAQQIVRSIATSVADKAMARAMNVDEDQTYSNSKPDNKNTQQAVASATQSSALPQPYKPAASQAQTKQALAAQNLENYNQTQRAIHAAQYDPYRIAIANTAFEELKPIAEPLPDEADTEVETRVNIVQGNQLVRVELFNLLIGDDKNAVYENARLLGATSLPQKREWALWRVATGAIQSDKKVITFLIPPEFGKLPSGAIALVELAGVGELNIARYKAAEEKVALKTTTSH